MSWAKKEDSIMSEDRWALDQQPTEIRSQTTPNGLTGIPPNSFHKKRRTDDKLTSTEKHLEQLLHQASKNEVVQKRKDFTSMQNVQLQAYECVTSFRIFPLQDLAMCFLDEMMKRYMGTDDDCTAQTSRTQNCHQQQQVSTSESSLQTNPTQINEMMLKDDYITAYLNEMKYNPSASKSTNDTFRFLPPLWSMEPRIFALETSISGKRKYIVGNLGRFINHYWRKSDPLNRHYYELIRENTPCRLYFDLEFCKISNCISMDDSEVLMSEFIDELCFQFKLVYKITLTRRYIVDLDSSTEKKFSRHLIVHLPNDELFENAQAAGLFAKRLVTRLADDLADGTLEKRHATLGRYLFVKTKDPTKTACFVDLGVYTRNRLFRLMGSSKFGKSASASLRISAANQFQFPSNFTNSSFYVPDMAQAAPSSKSLSNHDEFCRSLQWENHANALAITLVVPANASKMKFPILPSYSDNESSDITKVLLTSQSISSCSVIASRPTTASMKASGQSPIPNLDAFILTTVGKRGGVEGRIRAWSVEFTDGNYHLTYQMCENRWCERIGRHHKSNNIMWTVDLKNRACWQACHDSDCRGFRGSVVQFTDLHEDILAEIDEFLFDRELETLDITQVVACSQQNGNDEFEDALIDQAIRDIDMHVVSPDAKKISHDNEFDDDEVDRALQNLELPAMS